MPLRSPPATLIAAFPIRSAVGVFLLRSPPSSRIAAFALRSLLQSPPSLAGRLPSPSFPPFLLQSPPSLTGCLLSPKEGPFSPVAAFLSLSHLPLRAEDGVQARAGPGDGGPGAAAAEEFCGWRVRRRGPRGLTSGPARPIRGRARSQTSRVRPSGGRCHLYRCGLAFGPDAIRVMATRSVSRRGGSAELGSLGDQGEFVNSAHLGTAAAIRERSDSRDRRGRRHPVRVNGRVRTYTVGGGTGRRARIPLGGRETESPEFVVAVIPQELSWLLRLAAACDRAEEHGVAAGPDPSRSGERRSRRGGVARCLGGGRPPPAGRRWRGADKPRGRSPALRSGHQACGGLSRARPCGTPPKRSPLRSTSEALAPSQRLRRGAEQRAMPSPFARHCEARPPGALHLLDSQWF